MGRQEFTYPVGGSGDSPISTTQTEAFEVDNYDDAESVASSSYPIEVDPEITIQHLALFKIPADKTMDFTLVDGTLVTGIEPQGATAYLDGLQIEAITVNDPKGSGEKTSFLMMGE